MREDAALMDSLVGLPAVPPAERTGPAAQEKALAAARPGAGCGQATSLQACLT